MKRSLNDIIEKPRLLIVEDEPISAEILETILGDKYRYDFALNGKEALDKIHNNNYSLVLLDISMPVMDGFEVLKVLNDEDLISNLPVIVLTGERDYEIKSLQMGAIDFIKKPFEFPEVVSARVKRVAELKFDQQLIASINSDELTGLISKGFFTEYASRFVRPEDNKMDMVCLNIENFHLLNELHGRDIGDKVLKLTARYILEYYGGNNVIATRDYGDMFYFFTIHHESYEDFAYVLMDEIKKIVDRNFKVRLGVYISAVKDENIEDCITKAKTANDTLKKNYRTYVAYYDENIHEKELYDQRLIHDFNRAIQNDEFVVYLQPKYLVSGDKPVLAGAEALVRWIHPELKFVSPGAFIPLFEENGLIRNLDLYVFNKTAQYVKEISDLIGHDFPISANLSRVDILDDNLEESLLEVVKKSKANISNLHIEVTESAYLFDSKKMIDVVSSLRDRGFVVEMDDFGSGYSSLNTLSSLPFDILKIDMGFIRRMDNSPKDEKMVSFIIDLSKYLNVKVVAEGVETAEQVDKLKNFGCDYIQGYYFSKPIPYEEFLERVKKELLK